MRSLVPGMAVLLVAMLLFSCSKSEETTPPEEQEDPITGGCPTVSLTLDGSVFIDSTENLLLFLEAGYTRINGRLELRGVNDLSFLRCFTFIDDLIISGSTAANLEDLSNTSFNRLTIRGFTNLVDFQGIGTVNSLIKLRVGNNPSLVNFAGLSSLTSLGILDVFDNPSLVDFSGLENVTSNRDVPVLQDFEAREFSVQNCPNLQSLNGLQNLQGEMYSDLYIYDCENLLTIPAFVGLSKMKGFQLIFCPRVVVMDAFPNVTEIEFIASSDNPMLESFSFPAVTRSSTIFVGRSSLVTTLDFGALTEITSEFNLMSLKLEALNSLSDLSGFSNLQTTSNQVDILGNDNAFEIAMENICMLRTLYNNNGTDQNTENNTIIQSKCYYFDTSFVTLLEFDANCDCD